jgi:hypothetical protein
MMSMLQNMQVNSEDRDVAIRLLKTGRCVLATACSQCYHLHISVSVMSGNTAVQNYLL